jgi:threonine dehydratase
VPKDELFHMSLLPAESVLTAAARISGLVRRTRIIRSDRLSRAAGADVRLKLENEQTTGSFKLRGAMNVLAALDAGRRAQGVVASSAGNHGLGVAYAAKHFGARATIFIPSTAPRVKRDGIAALGATVDESQPDYDAAMDAAKKFAAEQGSPYINPCLGDDLLAGQGTVALEVLAECPGVQDFVVSVGGGGLLGGCASLLRNQAPGVRIIGAQSVNTAAMSKSLTANRIEAIENVPTLADGLAGQIDDEAFAIGKAGLDEIATVTEEEIARAILWLLDEHGLTVEGAGAVGVAAILAGKVSLSGETVVVVSGGNIDSGRIEGLRESQRTTDPSLHS